MDFIANIETEINTFIDQINSIISIAQAYVVFSSILLLIMFVVVAVGLDKISKLEKKIDVILKNEKGEVLNE